MSSLLPSLLMEFSLGISGGRQHIKQSFFNIRIASWPSRAPLAATCWKSLPFFVPSWTPWKRAWDFSRGHVSGPPGVILGPSGVKFAASNLSVSLPATFFIDVKYFNKKACSYRLCSRFQNWPQERETGWRVAGMMGCRLSTRLPACKHLVAGIPSQDDGPRGRARVCDVFWLFSRLFFFLVPRGSWEQKKIQ